MKRFVRVLFGVSMAFSMLNVLPVKAEGNVQLKEPQEQQTANDGSQAPEIISIDMDKTAISPEEPIHFTMRFHDNGFNAVNVYIEFKQESSNKYCYAVMHQDDTDPELWNSDLITNQYAYGKYEILVVGFYDDNRNEFKYTIADYEYSSDELLPEEFTGMYFTVDNPNPDTEAPRIIPPLVLSKTVLDGNSDKIQVTADIQEDGSGFSSGTLRFESDRGASYFVFIYPGRPIEIGENFNLSNERLYNGIYHLTGVSLTDKANNRINMVSHIYDPDTQVELPEDLASVSFEAKNYIPSGTWQTDSNGTSYVFDNGNRATQMILDIDGVTYVFDDNGYLGTGWFDFNGNRVYGENGVVAKSKWIEDVYYVKEDGWMAKSEWVDGDRYYVDRYGRWVQNAIKGQVNEIYPVYSGSGPGVIDSAMLPIGESVTFQYELVSGGAPITGNEVTWSSNATSIATVDQNGNVTAVGVGNASIKASLANGNCVNYYVKCIQKAEEMKFRDDAVFRFSDEYLTHDQAHNKFYANKYVMVLPEEGNGTAITVTSSDPSVIQTYGERFSVAGPGKCTLTFTPASNPDVSISHEFEVYESVVPQSVELIRVPEEVFVGYMYPDIEAVFSPEESNTDTVWTSSNPSIVTAPDPEQNSGTQFSLRNIMSAGTVTITAQSRYDANVSASTAITAVNGSPANGAYDVAYLIGEVDLSNWHYDLGITKEKVIEVGKTYVVFVRASGQDCVPGNSIGQQVNQQFFANNPGLKETQFQGSDYPVGPWDSNNMKSGWSVCFTVKSAGTYTYTVNGQSLTLYTAPVGSWKKDAKGWWFQYEDGTYARNEFLRFSLNDIFYFKDDGYMATGWIQVGEDRYYMGTGAMVKSQAFGEYYLKADGRMARNEEINGVYYGDDGKKVETEVHEVKVTADFEEPHPGNILGFPENISIPADVKYMTPEEYNETLSGQGVGDTSGVIFFGTIDNRETRYTWENQILERGMEFFYQYTVYAKEGYTFADDVTVKFNGKRADRIEISDDKKSMTLYVQYGPLSHTMTHVEAKEATCTEDGSSMEYYECSVCGKKYEDEEGTTEITIDVVLPKTGHDWSEWTVTKEATCTEAGEEERVCANDPTHKETREIEKLAHNMTHVEAAPATCTEDGNIEYYECSLCNKKYEDEEGTAEITIDVIVLKTGHAMTHVEAKDPTCTEDGNIEYYECGNCGKKFADEEGTTEITDVVIAKTGHTPEEGLSSDSNYHFHKCEVCGEPVEETKEAHTWTEWEKDLSAWTQTRKCTVCGNTETQSLLTGTWKQDANGWWYEYENGTYPKNEIKTIKGIDYYFNASGYMVTGWAQINGKWYVFDSSGAMKKNAWEGNYYLKEDGTMAVSEWVDNNKYYVGADGKWIPDYGVAKWKQDSNGWWYDNGDGTYPHGDFKTIDSTEYYFKENGYMATGWTQIDGKWYVFDSSGAMKKNTWEGNYYLKEDGTMAVSEWVDNGKYYVGADGLWIPDYGVAKWKQDSTGWWYDNGDGTYAKKEFKTIDGTTYYFNASGYMVTGWQQINGKWYSFTSSGAMKKSCWDGDYWLKEDGSMATSQWVDDMKYYVGPDGKWDPTAINRMYYDYPN